MQNVLITGGSGGLGFELVKVHLAQNFRVYALDVVLSDDLIDLQKKDSRLRVLQCDISSTDSVQTAIAQISKEIDSLKRVFNNAGICRQQDWVNLEQTDLDFAKTMFDINAVGALRIVKYVMPLLKAGSIIINTSSEAGSITDCEIDFQYAYCMSKAAMNMGMRLVNNELKDKDIRTLCIHPGRMKTNMGGPDSEIYPSETAESLMKMLNDKDAIPRGLMFMDYKGVPFNW